VKREVPQIRVLTWLLVTVLLTCVFLPAGSIPVAAQTTSASEDNNKPKEEAKPEDAKPKDDVTKDTPGLAIQKPGLHLDVDLALVNVTVTDPYNRLVTGLDPDNFRVFEDNIEQEVVTFSAEDVPI
jgi:Ca-activated chloride channel family protein